MYIINHGRVEVNFNFYLFHIFIIIIYYIFVFLLYYIYVILVLRTTKLQIKSWMYEGKNTFQNSHQIQVKFLDMCR
jgi:hypothetical protein